MSLKSPSGGGHPRAEALHVLPDLRERPREIVFKPENGFENTDANGPSGVSHADEAALAQDRE